MPTNLLIATGAGLIAALVFASAIVGSPVGRLVLLAVTSLPIAMAGYATNARTAFFAAAIGTVGITAASSWLAGVAFALTSAVPAAFLVYLALLHRDVGPGQVEWYPIGRVISAAALIGSALIAAGLALTGRDLEQVRVIVRGSLETMMKSGFTGLPGGAVLAPAELDRVADIMVQLLPGASAIFWMACLLTCSWLAAVIAHAGGRLMRPWPDLAAFQAPASTAPLLAAALGACLFIDDSLTRLMLLGLAGALYAVFVLLGLAIIHHRTRGVWWRGAALSAVYFALIVFNTAATLLIAFLGLADGFVPLRRLETSPHSTPPR